MNTTRVGTLLIRRLTCDQRIFSGVRYLYTHQYLGLDKYVEAREMTQKQFGSMKENFIKRMENQINNNAAQMIFTDDLKSVVHLCEANDLDMCQKMIKKFHTQNEQLRFGTFVFGPVVSRMLYHLGATDLSLEMVKDKELDGFFDQLKSYTLIMDLLFEEKRYQDIVDLSKILEGKQLLDTKFPRSCVTLTCAACYQMNTPESFKYVIDIVKEARSCGTHVVVKAFQFIIALAIKQNKPDIALELISSLAGRNNIIITNLKLVSLARLHRIQEAFQILQQKLEEDSPTQSFIRGSFCQSSLDVLQEVVDKLNDTEKSHQLQQLSESLKEASAITTQAIDEMLLEPIRVNPIRQGSGYGDRRQFRDQFGISDGDRRQFRDQFGESDGDFASFQRKEPFRRSASDGQRFQMSRDAYNQRDFGREDSFRNRTSGPQMQKNRFDQGSFERRQQFRNRSEQEEFMN